MIHFRLISLVSTMALVLASSSGLTQPPQSSPETACRAAIVAYAANIHSFPFYRCRYSITAGQAASVEDALAGKLTGAVTCTALQLVDGGFELLDLDAGPPPDTKNAIRRKDGTSIVSTTFSTIGYLGSGKRAIRHNPAVRSINLLPLDAHIGPENPTPLDMGVLGQSAGAVPDAYEAYKKYWDTIFVGPEIIDRSSLVTVRFREKKRFNEFTFSLDPKRGYLPARYQHAFHQDFEPKQFTSRSYLISARECSRGRWFPERIVRVDFDKRCPTLDVRDMRVLELDVDHHPDKKDFILRVPAGTYVCYSGSPRDGFRLKQVESIGLDDLEHVYTMVDESKTHPLMDTAIKRPSRSRWWAWGGGALGALIFLAGLTMLARRRLRQA